MVVAHTAPPDSAASSAGRVGLRLCGGNRDGYSSGMTGLRDNVVRLAPHDERWAAGFDAESLRLRAALGDLALRIEHIGSTAVPGLEAKPITDIAIMTPSFAALARIVAGMEDAGYRHKGEYGLPGRQFFTTGDPVRFHVHVVEKGSDHWPRWIRFRDALRNNAELRRAYLALKRELAQKFAHDRPGYTQAKSAFIAHFLGDAQGD